MKTFYLVVQASLLICVSTTHTMEEKSGNNTDFAEDGNYTHTAPLEEFIKTLKGLSQSQIESHCFERLDDTFQRYLTNFRQRSKQERSSAVFSLKSKGLEMYLLPKEDTEQLQNMPIEQQAPFFVLASLLQMQDAEPHPYDGKEEQRETAGDTSAKKRKLSHLLKKLIGVKT